jgi:hypothetical protein
MQQRVVDTILVPSWWWWATGNQLRCWYSTLSSRSLPSFLPPSFLTKLQCMNPLLLHWSVVQEEMHNSGIAASYCKIIKSCFSAIVSWQAQMSWVNDQQQQQVQQGLHSYTSHGLTCSKRTYSFLHLLVLLGKVVHQTDGLFFNDEISIGPRVLSREGLSYSELGTFTKWLSLKIIIIIT